jgi:hypothetical protein
MFSKNFIRINTIFRVPFLFLINAKEIRVHLFMTYKHINLLCIFFSSHQQVSIEKIAWGKEAPDT